MRTPLVEKAVSCLAPFSCLLCETEGSVVCTQCQPSLGRPVKGVCYRCNSLSRDFKTCISCRRQTKLKRVWVASHYEAHVKQLIREFKYERKRSAYLPLAKLIERSVLVRDYDFIVPVPVVSSHFRLRGYNQAQLIASYLSKVWKVKAFTGLYRIDQKRQVGLSRLQRHAQLRNSFYVSKPYVLKDKKILLIDDVITTGSTLENCALTLGRSETKLVEAATVAKA